ncbi:hypothetical protein IX329_002610 [Fusobacterium necrophorum]|nr:transposase [Fusobacterium necrophorum]KDE65689.1 transposase [Fusobacterium necrophorum BFTR-1]MBR8734993.1 hypothetical protein [Fusobacterium necrophorum]MBR8791168.1 hypothetical protein [Fusobacterium necrophorum]MBR8824068.1 hypothetical protein [Fusobacterium necrophorum]MCI7681300.1 transposase [Fusobacterium necrophorum]
MEYFHVNSIAKQWRFLVLDIVKNGNYSENIKKKALKSVRELYKKDVRLFFNVGSTELNSTAGIIKYLGRYLARAPIAEYKIVNFNDKEVTFFYQDLADNKNKKYRTMPIDEFVQQILIHLPPKNFKSISRFGFYARHLNSKLKKVILNFKKKKQFELSFYVKSSLETFDINPFICPFCKIKLKVKELFLTSLWSGYEIHKIYP